MRARKEEKRGTWKINAKDSVRRETYYRMKEREGRTNKNGTTQKKRRDQTQTLKSKRWMRVKKSWMGSLI